jgi:hypothetical protein
MAGLNTAETLPPQPAGGDIDLRGYLLGGQDSDQLLFTADYLERDLTHPLCGAALGGFLRDNPVSRRARAISLAAYEGYDFFGYAKTDKSESSVMQQFRRAGECAVGLFEELGLPADFDAREVEFGASLDLPARHVRNVGGLAVQRYGFYNNYIGTLGQ